MCFLLNLCLKLYLKFCYSRMQASQQRDVRPYREKKEGKKKEEEDGEEGKKKNKLQKRKEKGN